jgi:hydrogenase/urease accessory protein HupE
VQRWRSACKSDLRGQKIVIENLQTSLTDVILHFAPLVGPARTLRLDGAAPAIVIPAVPARWEVAGGYFQMGVEHILFGIDHLLFVFCLLLLVGDLKRLLGAVTAFTLAHSITLAGTTLGWLHLATAPVEACIALSIALVAAEIVKAHRGSTTGFTQRWPWLAAFAFGLLHGFGFAAALRDIGLPDGAIPLALLFFNLGVEAGQILFVGIVMTVVFAWRRYAPAPSGWVRSAPAYFAGVIACFWFFERALHILL